MGGFNADLQSFGCFEDLFDSTGGISVFVVILEGVDGHFSGPFVRLRMDARAV